MSDIRPLPPMESTAPVSKRDRLRAAGVVARFAYARSRLFVANQKRGELFLLQVLGALAVLIGISYFSIPCALIVGGIGAILVAERQ